METLIIIGVILVILGIIGSVTPVMPGPVFGFIALILLFFAKPGAISILTLVLFGIAMVFITVIDYIAPILGAKFSGASKKGLAGSVIGMLIGILFFPPLGIFIGAIVGSFLGELAAGKVPEKAIKAGLGTIFGSLAVMILQTIFSLVVAVYFFVKLF
jgi:uncharacterized protein